MTAPPAVARNPTSPKEIAMPETKMSDEQKLVALKKLAAHLKTSREHAMKMKKDANTADLATAEIEQLTK
jgi:hypothetical protein